MIAHDILLLIEVEIIQINDIAITPVIDHKVILIINHTKIMAPMMAIMMAIVT